jgi:hypothetical protein
VPPGPPAASTAGLPRGRRVVLLAYGGTRLKTTVLQAYDRAACNFLNQVGWPIRAGTIRFHRWIELQMHSVRQIGRLANLLDGGQLDLPHQLPDFQGRRFFLTP